MSEAVTEVCTACGAVVWFRIVSGVRTAVQPLTRIYRDVVTKHGTTGELTEVPTAIAKYVVHRDVCAHPELFDE